MDLGGKEGLLPAALVLLEAALSCSGAALGCSDDGLAQLWRSSGAALVLL